MELNPDVVECEDAAILEDLLKVIDASHSLCLGAKAFQGKTVDTWNEDAKNMTKVMTLKASEHKECSAEGNGMVFAENALMAGFLVEYKDRDGKTRFKLDDRLMERRLIASGDVMTIDMLQNFFKRVAKKIMECSDDPSSVDSNDLAEKLVKLEERVVLIPGDFHFSMHQLECLFKGFYGSYLQVFQYAMEFKNITKDPKEKYQKSKQFLSLIGWEMERTVWKEFLPEYVLDNAVETYDVVHLARSFIEYKEKLAKETSDEVLQSSLCFLELWNEFELCLKSTRTGDSVAMEVLYIMWLPVFTFFKKNHYKECSLRQMEALYKIDEKILHLIRCNRFIRLNLGRDMIPLDQMCEHLNRYLADMKDVKTVEKLVAKSTFLAIARASYQFVKTWMTGTGGSVDKEKEKKNKSSIAPGSKDEKVATYEFIAKLKLFTEHEGRDWDNWIDDLWAIGKETQEETEKRRKEEGGSAEKNQENPGKGAAPMKDMIGDIAETCPYDNEGEEADGEEAEDEEAIEQRPKKQDKYVVFSGYRMKVLPFKGNVSGGTPRQRGAKKLKGVVQDRERKQKRKKKKIQFGQIVKDLAQESRQDLELKPISDRTRKFTQPHRRRVKARLELQRSRVAEQQAQQTQQAARGQNGATRQGAGGDGVEQPAVEQMNVDRSADPAE